MFPGLVYAILSTDLDFVREMSEVLIQCGGEPASKMVALIYESGVVQTETVHL